MSDNKIHPICQKYNVTVPKTIENGNNSEISKLNDLAIIMRMFGIMADAKSQIDAIGKSLSAGGLDIYGKVRVEDPTPANKVIKTFEAVLAKIEALPPARQKKLAAEKAKFSRMLDLFRAASEKTSKMALDLSKKGNIIFLQTALEAADQSSTAKIVNTLGKTAEKLSQSLSANNQAKLGLPRQEFVLDYSKVVGVILSICTPEQKISLRRDPESEAHVFISRDYPDNIPEIPGKRPFFEYSVFGGSGYSKRFAGEGAPEVSADTDRGVLMGSGASGRINLSENLGLQIDYRYRAPYDVEGEDDLVLNEDIGNISVDLHSKKLDVLGQAGVRFYRSDYPSSTNPDVKAGTEALQLVYRLDPALSINISQEFEAGSATTVYNGDPKTYIRAKAQPSVSYNMGQTSIMGGAVVSYNNLTEGVSGGAIAGVSYKEREDKLSAIAGYERSTSSNTIFFGIDYFLGKTLGVSADYQFSDLGGISRHRAEITADAKFYFWGSFFVEPFLGGVFGSEGDKKVLGVNGGLFLGYGAIPTQNSVSTIPNSISPDPFLGGF